MKHWLWLCLCLPMVALADERILDFSVDILVRQDATLEVVETITVRAAANQIQRGIYRDFPTRYTDQYGNNVVVNYEPLSVLRDGRADGMRSESYGNGVRTYFGRADVFLEPGNYTYTFRYTAERMLGFFADYDELYWNVTGLGWAFPVDRAAATVRFAFEVDAADIGTDAWTGQQGATDQAYTSSKADSRADFSTSRPLPAGAGLTIAVNWPKGLVAAPDRQQKLVWLVRDNRDVLFALAGFLALLLYYVPVWYSFGRDPQPGVTFTRYEPPAGFSPASLRYIRRMGYDSKVFTAAVLNLAVKGYLTIVNADDEYTLKKVVSRKARLPLAKGEAELLEALFASATSVVLTNANHQVFSAAQSAHKKSLRNDYRNRLFRTNGLMNLPAAVLIIATIVLVFSGSNGPKLAVFGVLALMLASAALFVYLLKRPTGIGRKVLDETEGFREYLEIAEKDELQLRNPPRKTPELFESLLPFALALGVEQAWAEKFSGVFARLQQTDGTSYRPLWYSGTWNSLNPGQPVAGLGKNFTSAISSSMSPPGSSSGSGGGGFSGGGGGGGGGGGW
ncbi:DUF2207 domain-containing protein [Woeseia oceani]|uniref:DUF2207 domain-containing protein n=1 Tax=Woeseia oceani TaxID=1548547 RepID=A0A193LID3_9GAMM|nr:DUF2207 domain-containing protein [Woeseia oceani]ANO52251.1 hypothetical protein BA177_14580 [Woeseia oceani]